MRFTRVTLFFIVFIMVLGFHQLAKYFLSNVEPQAFQATEESMVDTANLLAELVGNDLEQDRIDTGHLHEVFDRARARRFEAKIFNHLKKQIGLNVYLTDQHGKVIFDSEGGKREGEDYSRRLDVWRTLHGEYGARSSRSDEANSATSILYVSAPVGDPLAPSGVLTVFKPQADVMPMIRERKEVIYHSFSLIGGGTLILITLVFLWLYRPIGRITEYARAIERGERPKLPKIGIGKEVNTLAHALESMREALEGRSYAEHYIQTLTHEMKSPLAAIRGAAELLDEDMPPETRQRFLENIRAETSRTERLINRLLELSAIESKVHLESTDSVDFQAAIRQAIEQATPLAELSGVRLVHLTGNEPIHLRGDAFILRAAITNLLENAVDFSPRGSEVEISTALSDEHVTLSIRDHGDGIPDYAGEKIFERFYSLRHHTSGRKGTGLGLTLVKEAADLHGGSISLQSNEGQGTTAIFTLPLA